MTGLSEAGRTVADPLRPDVAQRSAAKPYSAYSKKAPTDATMVNDHCKVRPASVVAKGRRFGFSKSVLQRSPDAALTFHSRLQACARGA